MLARALWLAGVVSIGCGGRALVAGDGGADGRVDASIAIGGRVDGSAGGAAGDGASPWPSPFPGRATWSAWPLPGHDPANTRRSPNVGPQVPVERFALDVFAKTVVIGVDGTIYAADVGDTNPISAFDPATGTRLWSFQPTPAVPATVPPSSPSIATGPEGNVYAGYRSGPFVALHRDGAVRWQFTTGKTGPKGDNSAFGQPLVDFDGRVYVGEASVLYAFEADGRMAWKFDARSIYTVFPAAIARDGTVYVREEYGALHALGRDGTLRWTLSTSSSVSTLSSPIVRDDGTLLFPLFGERQFGLVDAAGRVLWQKPGAYTGFALGADDAPYVADASGVLRMDRTGSVVWQAAAGGRDAIVDGAGTVYSTATGSIAAIDARGVLKWQLSAVDPANPSTALVTPGLRALGGDGTLYVLFGGRLHAIGGGGRCEGKPVDCDDGDPCTVDRCDAATGCVHEPKCVSPGACTTARCGAGGACTFAAVADGTTCDDGIACSRGDACRAGQCLASESPCAPGNAWPSSAHDARHTRATALLGPAAPTLKWSAGTSVQSFVVAEAGTLYAAGDNRVRTISPEGLEAPFAPLPATDLVLRGDGGLYAIALPSAGILHALDAAGSAQWTFTAPPPLRAPAVGASGVIYATTRFEVVALKPDGSTLWRIPTGGAVSLEPPAIGPDGTVYALCSDLWAIAPDGRVKWKRPVGWAKGLVVGPTGTAFVISDGDVRAFDAGGAERWTWLLGERVTLAPALAPGGDLILTAGPTIYRLDATTGLQHASLTPAIPTVPAPGGLRQQLSPPIVDGNNVLYVVANATDNSFNPMTQATVYAFDRSNRVVWSIGFPARGNGSGGNLAIGPGRMLYVTIGGVVQAIGP